MTSLPLVDEIDFAKYPDGLVPAIVQDAASLQVLMLGYMSREALQATLSSLRVTFDSRSRGELWQKGATSGNVLQLVSVSTDCDRDALLVLAAPAGPTCHNGTDSCFAQHAPASKIAQLESVVAARMREQPQGSYTADLVRQGVRRVAQKVGEEGVETALAAVAQSDDELIGEAADLVYHLMVLLKVRGLSWSDIERRL